VNEGFYPNSLVNIYPKFDQATVFTNMWGKATENAIKESYPNLTAFVNEDTNRKNVEVALETEPDFAMHWDHGGKDCLGGWNKELIIDTKNVNLLADMHFYTFSCMSASRLGPAAIKAGCYSYVGFKFPAFCYAPAESFQRKAAIYYPVHLTKELEALNLEYPDPEQEIEVVKKVFGEHKKENYRQAIYAMVTIMGGILMILNTLHLTLLTGTYEPEEEEELELTGAYN
jgi:hypothetical protein